MVRQFRSSDKGKTVLSKNGDEIGTVERVSGNKAHVKPASNLSRSVRQRLGWTDEDEEMYELMHSHVSQISNDEIHLKD